MSNLMNLRQASEFLGLSKNTLYAYVAGRRIPHYKIGAKLLFDLDELTKWRRSKRVPMFDEQVAESRKNPVSVK